MLVNAGMRKHAVALGDCSGAFYRAPLTRGRIFLEPPPDAGVPEGHIWEALRDFPELQRSTESLGRTAAGQA
eukprot:2662024-Pyramimonas_sp.AAC.1